MLKKVMQAKKRNFFVTFALNILGLVWHSLTKKIKLTPNKNANSVIIFEKNKSLTLNHYILVAFLKEALRIQLF